MVSLESLLNCLSTVGSELWVSDWEISENKSPSSHSGNSWAKKDTRTTTDTENNKNYLWKIKIKSSGQCKKIKLIMHIQLIHQFLF